MLPPVPPPAAAPAATPVMAPPATAAVPAPLPATARQAVPVAVALPQAGPTDGLDWPALRTAVADCRACGLCESRRQTVFGTGHPQAHCMVVGEAPGEQEDAQGEPFVGAAGQLLDRMLAALQLTRSTDGPEPPAQRVYIANTLKCRPPRNRNPAMYAPSLQRIFFAGTFKTRAVSTTVEEKRTRDRGKSWPLRWHQVR